ncbi:hypothetical protein Tco_1362542 [Tanacetum coccineum]
MRGSVDYGSWVSSISPSRTIGWLLAVVDMAGMASLKGSIGSGSSSGVGNGVNSWASIGADTCGGGAGRESDMFLKTLSSTKSRFLEAAIDRDLYRSVSQKFVTLSCKGVGLITKASYKYGWRFVACDGPESTEARGLCSWNWVSWDDLFSASGTILAVPFCLCVYFGDGGFYGKCSAL